MPSYRSYVGDADDPDFRWDGIPDEKFRVGNLPRRVVPADPFDQLGLSGLWVLRRIDAGDTTWRRIDWAGWGAMMAGAAILSFWEERTPRDNAWAMARWTARRAELAALAPERRYVLVVAEEP